MASRKRDIFRGIPRRDGLWLRVGRWWYHPVYPPVPVIAGGTSGSNIQTRCRFRNDDGSETTATWVAAENANASLNVDTNYRIRIKASSSLDLASATLRYSHNVGAYTAVSASSNVVRASASPNVTDGTATTEQLTAGEPFIAGSIDEVDGTATCSPLDDEESEFEYCFQIRSADVANGDTIDFRAYSGTTAFATYTVTIRATVVEGAGGAVSLRPRSRLVLGVGA
jgi:hypothetical protein